jgi:hypothetical protein
MKLHRTLLPLSAALVILSACAPAAPSEGAIQTAIAETQALQSSPTPSPVRTSTATAAPTDTPTPTASPTPDARVVDVNPKNLVLTKADLPQEGAYFLPAGWPFGPVTNAEIIAAWTVEEGQEYVAKSGRIYGWETEFARGSSKVVAPQDIYNEVVIYSTPDRAVAVVKEDAGCSRFEGYREQELDAQIGDASLLCVSTWNGLPIYRLEAAYRNLIIVLSIYGNENEVSVEFLEDLAQKQLSILERQPLSESVTFRP